MNHSNSIAAIAKALAAAQAEYRPVPKNKTAKIKTKTGGEYTYSYADLADILDMALPRLAKQGVAFSQPHIIVDGKLRVVTYLLHESGEWMHSDGIEISEDGDPQQFGAESTYFRRYDGASFIGVAPDEDTDAQGTGDRTRKETGNKYPAMLPTTPAQVVQRKEQGLFKLLPPNNDELVCTVLSVVEKKTMPAPGKTGSRPYLVVTVNGFLHPECDPDNPNINAIFCYDAKLFDAVKHGLAKQCHLKLDLTGKFVKLVDVLFIDETEYKDGKPVIQGE